LKNGKAPSDGDEDQGEPNSEEGQKGPGFSQPELTVIWERGRTRSDKRQFAPKGILIRKKKGGGKRGEFIQAVKRGLSLLVRARGRDRIARGRPGRAGPQTFPLLTDSDQGLGKEKFGI